ncbi:MAG: sodium:proton antiporter [Gammaproteobacteria bacterium]|nr:sodium:proton antiporter [Gammaproteobacteria bacterium]NIR84436.1 sodium:proton antiporter [Gammaproteobacteria bacterium]NIR90917.1 sodium:proton antiporter [Gammaproteobacteria bacterium]NIU07103.1 sodium:proton antiporter [Gammaproteobacteria bacterium]NIV76232.1 sodium:proton antiporter [Gammaproteobacteria bacterium]
MALVPDILSWILLVAGGLFLVTGGIGLLRLPDFFTRLHAAGLTDTLGAALTLLGLALQAGLTLVTVKLLLIFAFLFFTSPTATHALAKAALHGKVRPLAYGPEEDTPSQPS